jgi:hypothetical protein
MDEANEAYEERVAARHDALVRDAARYRWLRGGPDVPEHSVRWPRWEVRHYGNGYWNTLFAEKLDAAIDMAMSDDAAPNG